MSKNEITSSEVAKRTIYAQPSQVSRKPGFNPRFDFGDMEAIKNSIKAHGFYAHKPLLVTRGAEKDTYVLVDGDRRLTAVEALIAEGHKFPEGIPLAIASKELTETALLVMAITANETKPFLPLEEAQAIKTLRDSGMTIAEICRKLSKHPPQIQAALALVDADESVKEAVKSGKMGATLARDISRKAKGDKEKQKALVEKATKGKDSKKAVQEEVQRIQSAQARRRINPAKKEQALGPTQLKELSSDLYRCFVAVAQEVSLGDIDAVMAAIKADPKMEAAYYLGAYLASKQACGGDVVPNPQA